MMTGIFTPLPIIWVSLRFGMKPGAVMAGLVLVSLVFVAGPLPAFLFFAEYGILALILSEGVRQGQPFDRCIAFSALGATVISILLLFFVLGEQNESFSSFFKDRVDSHIAQSMEALKSMGESPADLKLMQEFSVTVSELFTQSYPAILLIGSLVTASLNYVMAQFISRRLHLGFNFHPGKYSEWVAPEQAVWALLASGGAVAMGDPFAAVGMNVFLVALVVYFAQGLSIVVHFLETRNVHAVFWGFVFLLILFQPILMGIIIGMGVFDLWADFRKLKSPPIDPDTV